MTKKILSYLLIVVMILSFNVHFSFAEPEGGQGYKITIDLREYSGAINQELTYEKDGIEERIFLEAGKLNILELDDANYYGWAALTDFEADQNPSNCSWKVEGVRNGLFLYDETKKTHIVRSAEENYSEIIQITKNVISINKEGYEVFSWDKGTNIILKPLIANQNIEVLAETEKTEEGNASVKVVDTGKYEFTAVGNDGYAFDYWIKKGDENNKKIYTNPYQEDISENTTYTAHFRKRYETRFIVDSDNNGITEVEYINSSDGKDKYRITAKPNTLYKFSKWQIGEGEDAEYKSENPIEIEIGEADAQKKYTAIFEKANAILLEQEWENTEGLNVIYAGIEQLYIMGEPEVKTLEGIKHKEVISGGRCKINIPFEVDGDVAGNYYFMLSLSSADGNTNIADNVILKKYAGNEGRLIAGKKYSVSIVVDPMPEIDGLNAELTLRTDQDRLEPARKTYEIKATKSNSEDNGKFKYINSEGTGHKSEGATPISSGFSAMGVYGRVNSVTKDAEVYFFGNDGVAELKAQGQNDLTALGKLPDEVNIKWKDKGVFALGTAKDGGLIALAEVESQRINNITTPGYETGLDASAGKWGKHFIYRWNGKDWSRVEDSCFSRYNNGTYTMPGMGNNGQSEKPKNVCGIVMAEDDIWTNYYHWNGTNWEINQSNLVFFTMFKKSDNEAYGSTLDGIYQYKDKTWKKIIAVDGSVDDKPLFIESINENGHILLADSDYSKETNYYDFDVNNNELKAIGRFPEGLTQQQEYTNRALIDEDNDIYISAKSRNHEATGGYYDARSLYRYDNGVWRLQNISEFDDPKDKRDESVNRIRPDGVTHISNPLQGISILHGPESLGANYIYAKDVTLTFNAKGGQFREGSSQSFAAPILSPINADKLPSVNKEGKYFGGWYYDEACSKGKEWNIDGARMPAENLTLYAKWLEKGSNIGTSEENPELVFQKKKALATLKQAFDKCLESDYKASKWKKLLKAYEDGQRAINAAPASEGKYIENNVVDALNKAIAAIQAIPAEKAGKIDVVVSMDASTLGLGYLIKPTLVTVRKGTTVSEITDELIRNMTSEKFGVGGTTLSSKGNSEPKQKYPSIITGSISNSYYLAQVYYPKQQDVKIPQFIRKMTGNSLLEEDKNGNYLGEFDYYNMSGWMYSVSDGSKYPQFPGMGAASWKLSDGEVVRWQFTVYGYGADLNADNSAWGTSSLVPSLGDKTSLTRFVAELRSQYKDEVLEQEDAYNKAIEALTNPEIEMDELKLAKKALESVKFPEISEDLPSIKPDTKVSGGTATAEINSGDLKKAVEKAEKDKKDSIVIKVETKENVKKSTLNLAKEDIETLAKKDKLKLDVKTSNGNVQIPSEVLKNISEQANGKSVAVNIETVKPEEAIAVKEEKGKEASKEKLVVKETIEKIYKELPIAKEQPKIAEGVKSADIAVLEVKINSAEKHIRKLGSNIHISIPTSNRYEKGKYYEVTQISEDGTIEKHKGRCEQEGKKKYVKIAVNHLSTFVVNPEPISNLSFTDIEGHWAYDAIKYAVEKKLMNGISDSAFAPDFTLSRAMLTTILYRMEKEPKVAEALAYGDVAKGEWYADAVAWASKEGIVTGYSDSVFAPNDNITREQMAAMLMRYSKYKKMDVSKTKDMSAFKDANSISSWATDAMSWAGATGLVNGRTADTIAPIGTATRAEAATILKRYMENVVQGRKPGKTEAAS